MEPTTNLSAADAAADTSNVTNLPDATERRIAAVNRAVDKAHFELNQVRNRAWSNGLAGKTESIEESTAANLLLQAISTLQMLALGVAEDGDAR